MRDTWGRRAMALSVLVALVGSLGLASGIARADTIAILVQPRVSTGSMGGAWSYPSDDPSGAAWIEGADYLMVVDTNNNDPTKNGWRMNVAAPATATPRATGVAEPTGLDYDALTNTLFISSDDPGLIVIVSGFDTPTETRRQIQTEAKGSYDTEDPAYNPINGHLYWVDGHDGRGGGSIFDVDPGTDGVIDPTDAVTEYDIDTIGVTGPDWEGLAWDPQTGFLLLGNTKRGLVHRLDVSHGAPTYVDTIVLPDFGLSGPWISGMGMAPASYDSSKWSLWVTDRNWHSISEFAIDGTVPPTTTTTTQPTTTTTQPTTTTTQPTTTTTTSPSPPPSAPTPSMTFTDTKGHLFAEDIEWLVNAGITKGCGPSRFCPDDRVTRGQMAAFLVRAMGYTAGAGDDLFGDDDNSTFENDIDRLATSGLTKGCAPNRFCPNDYVTRGQMAAFLVRAFGYSNLGVGNLFADDNGHVFEKDIAKLATSGVTKGCAPNRFCPNDFVTRGQMAAFLRRALTD